MGDPPPLSVPRTSGWGLHGAPMGAPGFPGPPITTHPRLPCPSRLEWWPRRSSQTRWKEQLCVFFWGVYGITIRSFFHRFCDFSSFWATFRFIFATFFFSTCFFWFVLMLTIDDQWLLNCRFLVFHGKFSNFRGGQIKSFVNRAIAPQQSSQ